MKVFLVVLFLLTVSPCFSDEISFDINQINVEDRALVTHAARSLLQNANNDVYIKADYKDGKIVTAGKPIGKEVSEVVDEVKVQAEIDKVKFEAEVALQKQIADFGKKKDDFKAKMNWTDKDIEDLRQILNLE